MKLLAVCHVVGIASAALLLGIPVVATGAPETTVSFSVADVAFSTRQGFDVVEVEGCHLAGEPGEPLLPCMAVNFVIPRDKQVAAVKFEPQQKLRLKGHYRIYPAQPESSWVETGFVEPDPDVYESANPYPGDAILEGCEMVAWGWNTYQLKLWPLEYIPAKGELWLYQAADISLELVDGEPSQEVLPRSQELHEEWSKELEGVVVNPGDVWSWAPEEATALAPTPKWVLVLPNNLPPFQWIQAFEQLILWRQAQGYEVAVGYVSEILNTYPGDTDQQKVRNYLKEQGARWALLAGDDLLVPMHDEGPYGAAPWGFMDVLTDWYYCDLDGEWPVWPDWPAGFDWTPECWAGRVPCTCPSEAGNFVQKVLEYEQYDGDPAYLGRAFYETADYAQYGCQSIQEVVAHQDTCIDTTCYRERPGGLAYDPWFPYAEDVLAELNGTRFGIVTVHCHGGASTYSCLTDGDWAATGTTISWFGPYYIESLANQGQYFFWYSCSCLNANLDPPDPNLRTVAELSTCVHPDLGAVAFAGYTETSTTGSAVKLQCHAWDQLFPQGPIQYGSCFNHAGAVEALSKWRAQYLGPHVGWRDRYAHNLFGDPATPIWTPRAMPSGKPLAAGDVLAPLRIASVSLDPNPVRSQARVRFYLSRPAELGIGVYDVTGRLVQAVHQGIAGAGMGTRYWACSGLSPGVYTVRLESGGIEATRRVVILR